MRTVKIKGMSCSHCVMAVTKALSSIEGITNVSVDLKSGDATFEETAPVDMSVIRERLKNAGYETV
jgi:copper chaperone